MKKFSDGHLKCLKQQNSNPESKSRNLDGIGSSLATGLFALYLSVV